MTILVTGARGRVGGRVLARLLDAGTSVRAASTDPSALDLPPGVDTVALDLTAPETLEAALDGVTGVFLYTQPGGIDDFVQAAHRAGVEHVVQLSSLASLKPDAETDPIGSRHLAVEKVLAKSGLPFTVLLPGAFATNSLAWAGGIRARSVVEVAYPDAQFSPVHQDDLAAVAVSILGGGTHLGESLVVTGPESLSFRQQAEVLGAELGRPITVTELTRAQAQEQRPAYIPEQVMEGLLDAYALAVGVPAPVTDTIARVTGAPARTYREWVRDHLADFEG